jgi:hypothetical protein
MSALSKSRLIAWRQCPRRLWLEVNAPSLRQVDEASTAQMLQGDQVGQVARQLYTGENKTVLIDARRDGYEAAQQQTQDALSRGQTVFEARLGSADLLAFSDVLLPQGSRSKRRWKMVEVKSSTQVKAYHLDDTAIQATAATLSGVPLDEVAVAVIDSQWVYPGDQRYDGLLVEHDVTEQALARHDEVLRWLGEAQSIVRSKNEPIQRTGTHCQDPVPCGFQEHCRSSEPQAEHPVEWLPGAQKKVLKAWLAEREAPDLRDVPDELLSEVQRRVKTCTRSGEMYFDEAGAAADLSGHRLPAYFMDFETVHFAVPIWKGTRPYQQIPFQFSVHRLARTGRLEHDAFLDLSGRDPSRPFAQALIDACGSRGPIYVYNAGFEGARLDELARRFVALAAKLQAIRSRLVDLLPVTRNRLYHPDQKGSWSIKAVLPVIAPDLDYDRLVGVQNGGAASAAYLSAINPATHPDTRIALRDQLLAYCHLDTLALVRVWRFLSGSKEY